MLQLIGAPKELSEQDPTVQTFRATVDKGHFMEAECFCISFD